MAENNDANTTMKYYIRAPSISIITVVICNTTLANTDYESCITRIIHHRLEVTSFKDTLETAVYDQVHDGVSSRPMQ